MNLNERASVLISIFRLKELSMSLQRRTDRWAAHWGEQKKNRMRWKMLHRVCLIPFCIIDIILANCFFLNNWIIYYCLLPQRVPDLDKKLSPPPPSSTHTHTHTPCFFFHPQFFATRSPGMKRLVLSCKSSRTSTKSHKGPNRNGRNFLNVFVRCVIFGKCASSLCCWAFCWRI